MEEKIYFDFEVDGGNVRVAGDVVAAIAARSACEVDGIAGLAASAPDIADMLIKKSGTSGVHVEKIDEVVSRAVKFPELPDGCHSPAPFKTHRL